MRTNKSYLWLALLFVGVMATAAAFAYPDSTEETVQADEQEIAVNGIESSSSVITKVEPSNPLEFLTAGAAVTDAATEVTVYNDNLALVKERRSLNLKTGVNSVEYTDVAALIDPTSVMFEDTKNKNTAVLEQNYEYDLVSSYKLLDKFLGKEITATEKEGETYTGTLLSHDGGVVLQLSDGNVVSLSEVSKFEFPDSAGLLTKPTLVWQVYSPVAGSRDVLTSYLTSGMNWNADYIVKTNADDTKADIQGWVSIDNGAGTTYENARLKLVAGEVHRTAVSKTSYDYAVDEAVPMSSDGGGGFVEETLFEYHLYTLERPATLKNNQVKQISLLSADSVPVEKELIFDVSKSENVQAVLNLENSKEKGLGMPLPAGVMRVYKSDSDGQLQFLGEDSIDHTPKDEDVKVVVGNSFDVTATRTQTDYDKVSNDVRRQSYEIELKNHKSEAQTVRIVEHFYGDWEIITSSDSSEKTDAYTVEWEVTVPSDGSKKITFTVEYRY
ncbi:hypothetical protein MSSIT_2911 [Methanosarcina siciliae T4/M]|uniref:DUF4139 domain-containing protein n=2 Tax=Methanosarcina siciliae TaxID=38027 RepID=A0A0E3PHM1_9EURY|nr:DUF4139 domain-containing protein [Methanosarcina siciliae]AKB29630.1 hypothetical protein MSSIT_2911 [Methanosarcina siciliae T4/M]AKB33565.1 hypothetical protein MSSIH_2875 [Methanosarcina siciliae HI350]